MSLQRVLQTQNRLDNEDELASILLQICDALAHAHQFGVLHRDLKPGNIFLLEQNNKLNVKVLDFGIAKPMGQQTGLTQAGYSVGSPLYMSPEQCRGHAVDFRSDVYSLGILAYEMTTGKLPYGGHNIMTVMAAHCDPDKKPPDLNTQVPDLCRVDDLNETIQTAMQTDPAKRFQSIGEFKQSVQKWHDAVTKQFLSTLVPGQPRSAHHAKNAGTGTSDSHPDVANDRALRPIPENGASAEAAPPAVAPQQLQEPVLTPQQIADQQEHLKQQKLQHQQMLQHQQIQPQHQHQLMQRQQMKPLPPPPQVEEQQQVSSPLPQQQNVQQSPQQQVAPLQNEQQIEQLPKLELPIPEQQENKLEKTLQEPLQSEPKQQPPQQNETVQNSQKPPAPDAVPSPKLRTTDSQPVKRDSESKNSLRVTSTGGQNSRLRNQLNVGDVGSSEPTNKSKTIMLIVIGVTVLLLIAFLVLIKLVLQ